MTTDLPPDTAERLAEALDHWWLSKRDIYEIMERLRPIVAQLVAERTEALELSLAADRRHILDELHMLGVLQDQQAKLADARAEGAAEALIEMADAVRTTEVLFRRPDGSGVTFTDLLRDRAAAIRKGRKA